MADYNSVLFSPSGTATPLFLARWRSKGALTGLRPALTLTVGGVASLAFSSLWNAAFPTRKALPDGPLHTPDGKPTKAFLDAWT